MKTIIREQKTKNKPGGQTMKKMLKIAAAILSGTVMAAEPTDFQPERDGGWQPKAETKDGTAVLTAKQAKVVSARSFEVDPNAVYRLSGKFRSTDPAQKTLFFGMEAMNGKGAVISSPAVFVIRGTETELVEELKKGDTTVTVKDASKWDRNSNARVIAFNVKDDFGDLPNMQFSPNIRKIEQADGVWKITLIRPSGSDFPAATRIRQHSHGMGRIYNAAFSKKMQGEQWQEFSGEISGIAPSGAPANQWWQGTKKARIIIAGTPGIAFKDVKLEKVGGKVELTHIPRTRQNAEPAAPLFAKYLKELPRNYPRPRLLFNDEKFAGMRRDLSANPLLRQFFARLRGKVDNYPDDINEQTYQKHFYSKDKFGPTAMRAAFVYKLTGEPKYRDKAIKILKYASEWYQRQYAEEKAISWTAFSRISALCAYDWLYNEIPEAERTAIGRRLLAHIEKAQDTNWIIRSGLQNKGEGTSRWNSSFYGTPLLKFYAGLVFHDSGINDRRASKFLKEGVQDHIRMLDYRSNMAGNDGGGNNSSPGYVFGDGPVCEWLFYVSWETLTGRNIAMDFPANGLLPHWLFYATFPGMDGRLYEHGTGGAWHLDNKVKMNLRYLALYKYFFKNHPASGLIDYFISTQEEFKDDNHIYASGTWNYSGYFPWLPFLYRYTKQADYKQDKTYFSRFPNAYFFRNLGQTYMFSGSGADSTYAMFTCGTKSPAHKQPDENNFIIYKGGFLALDSGTRSASGMKNWLDDMWHDNNYNAASIAHNVITIFMEGEKFRGWPAQKYAVANHGGMYKTVGGVVKAFETNEFYTYVSGDSTACYHPEKCKKMIRQFVFIQPDYFAICDTVESAKDNQPQTWLLHSQNEPVENGDTFRFDEGAGRLFCRTFLPKDFKRTKIGGPGKEFWVDGKNYPLGKTRLEEYASRRIQNPLWGNWRMEITPGKAVRKVRFLNLIQVGMKKNLNAMVKSEYIQDNGKDGIRFSAGDTEYSVLFDEDGNGGHIKAVRNGKTVLERDLSKEIQMQKAFSK